MILVRLLGSIGALILLAMSVALVVSALGGPWWMVFALAPWWGFGGVLAIFLLVTLWEDA